MKIKLHFKLDLHQLYDANISKNTNNVVSCLSKQLRVKAKCKSY